MPYAEIIDDIHQGAVLQEERVGIMFKSYMKRYATN
jgi:hypothetical protein